MSSDGNSRKQSNTMNEFQASFESLEPRVLLAAAPTFANIEDIGDFYWLNNDGKALTLGLDGEDADGDALTVSITSDDSNIDWTISHSTGDNRFAVMKFYEEDGETLIGNIVVQLFEDRAPLMTERFITLAENYVTDDGLILEPTEENPAFYTDVVVHRVMDEFMFQTGDAEYGNGLGSSPLPDFETETDDNLSFTNGGVLAAANSGEDSTNCQWFITEIQNIGLDGEYTIFGQIISGWDVYEQIISTETDDNDRPLSTPILKSVEIMERPQDATVTIWADEYFDGTAEIQITLNDGINDSEKLVIKLASEPTLTVPEFVELPAGEHTGAQTIIVPITVDFAADHSLIDFQLEHTYTGDGADNVTVEIVEGGDTGWQLEINTPAEYDGSPMVIAMAAYVDSFDNRISTVSQYEVFSDNILSVAYEKGDSWFDLTQTYEALPILAEIDDMEIAPSATVTLELDITYSGDLEDLSIWTDTDYLNGGNISISDAVFNTDTGKWEITIEMPEYYDGEEFEISIMLVPTNIADYVYYPVHQEFNVFFDDRGDVPVIDDPGELVLAPNTDKVITLSATDDLATEFHFKVTTSDTDITATIDDTTKVLTVTAAEDFVGEFTLYISVWEQDIYTNYPSLTPGELEVSGIVVNLPVFQESIVNPDGIAYIPFRFEILPDAAVIDFSATSSDYTGTAVDLDVISTAMTNWYVLQVTLPADYDGTDFNVTVSADFGDDIVVTADAAMTAGARPLVQLADIAQLDPDSASTVALNITAANTSNVTITVLTPNPETGVTVAYNDGTGELEIDPGGYEGQFDVTISAIETAWLANDAIDAEEYTFTFSTALSWTSDLADTYVLNDSGYGLVIPVDAWAPGDAVVTISATSSSSNVLVYASNNNPVAELAFTDADGNAIGSIFIELFADRFAIDNTDIENALERFITLATNEIVISGYDLENDESIYELDNTGTPYYTDLPVYLVLDDYLFQTGDATSEDGTGTTPLPDIEDDFGPAPYTTGALGYSGSGVLAMVDYGDDSANNEFIVTSHAYEELNGEYVAFGQVISGTDVLEVITTTETSGYSPINAPILSGITIDYSNTQDGSVTIVPQKKFSGEATVDITIASDSGSITRTITVVDSDTVIDVPEIQSLQYDEEKEKDVLDAGIEDQSITPGEIIHIPFVLTEADLTLDDILIATDYAGSNFRFEIEELGDGDFNLIATAPIDYDGSTVEVTLRPWSENYQLGSDTWVSFNLSFSDRPEITQETGINLAPDTQAAAWLPFSVSEEVEVLVEVTPNNPDIIAEFFESTRTSTSAAAYQLTVTPGGYEGIITITVTAMETVYGDVFSTLAANTVTYYICTYNGGETVEPEDDDIITEPGAEAIKLNVPLLNDVGLVYTIESSTAKVLVSITGEANATLNGTDNTYANINLDIPADYTGVFTITITVYYDEADGDKFYPVYWTIPVTSLPEYDVDEIEDNGNEYYAIPATPKSTDLGGDYISVVETVTEGDLMYALTLTQGLITYDVSDPDNPEVIDAYDSDDYYYGMNYTMKIIHPVVDGQVQTYVLIAGGSYGLASVHVNDDGTIASGRYDNTYPVYDLAIYEDYVYCASGTIVSIFDISDPGRPACYEDDYLAGVAPTDKYYAKYQNNLSSKQLWYYPFSSVSAVEVRGNRLYVAERYGKTIITGKGERIASYKDGWVGILRLGDPLNPEKRRLYRFTEEVLDMEIHGSRLLVATTTKLKSYSLGDPDKLAAQFGIETQGTPSAISVCNQTVVLSTSIGYEFYDISTPTKPEYKGIIAVDTENWLQANISSTYIDARYTGDTDLWWLTPNHLTELDVAYGYRTYAAGETLYLPVASGGIVNTNALALAMTDPDDIQSGKSYSVYMQDTKVTFSISGGGTLDIDFDNFGNWINAITVNDATEKTKITVKTYKSVSVEIIDITINGSAKYFNGDDLTLTGDFTATGAVGKLLLGNVGSAERVEQTISIGEDENGADSIKMQFGWISDLRIVSLIPITQLLAYGWVDDESELDGALVDEVDSLTAPSVGTLKMLGDSGEAGMMQAGLNLNTDDSSDARYVLNYALIKGDMSEAIWDIDGNINKIKATGDLIDSDILAEGTIGSLYFVNADTVTVDADSTGTEDPAIKTATFKGDMTAATWNVTGDIKTATIKGDMSESTWNVTGNINKLKVSGDVDNSDVLAAGTIKTLYFASADTVNIAADSTGTDDYAIKTATIKGDMSESTWNVTGDISKLKVSGDVDNSDVLATGTIKTLYLASADTVNITADSTGTEDYAIKTATVKGDMSDATWDITGDVKTLSVTGSVESSRILASGSMQKVTLGRMEDSDIYAGYVSDTTDTVTGLPSAIELADASLFDLTETISKITVKGIRQDGDLVPGFINSNIAAGTIASASIKNPQEDNDDVSFGIATDTLDLLKLKLSGISDLKFRDLTETADSQEPLTIDDAEDKHNLTIKII